MKAIEKRSVFDKVSSHQIKENIVICDKIITDLEESVNDWKNVKRSFEDKLIKKNE